MGYWSNRQVEEWSRGYGHLDTFFCKKCIGDAEVWTFWKRHRGSVKPTVGQCSYCNAHKAVWSSDDLLDVLIPKLYEEWEDISGGSVHYDKEEDKYVGSKHEMETDEMLEFAGFTIESSELLKDICKALAPDTWCERDPYVETETDLLKYSWNNFSNIVKTKLRYTFFRQASGPSDYLYSPLELLENMNKIFKINKIIKTINVGTTLYRVRPGYGYTKGKEIGTPPLGLGGANRMSPAGICMFYGAFDEITCFKEIFDFNKSKKYQCSLGEFVTKYDLHILDLSMFHKSSIFNEDNKNRREILRFLNHFQSELSKPLLPEKAQIDYIPTQVLTEFIRYNFLPHRNYKLDGIQYRSSKHIGSNCVVLFVDNQECGNPGDAGIKLELVSAANRLVGR